MDIAAVEVLEEYRVRLTFVDGLQKIVDLEPKLHGRLFGELRDPVVFRQVRVDAESGTIVWPNGADICPEMLYLGLPSARPTPRSPRKARPKPRSARRTPKS